MKVDHGLDSLFPCLQPVDRCNDTAGRFEILVEPSGDQDLRDDTARCIERRRRHVYLIIFRIDCQEKVYVPSPTGTLVSRITWGGGSEQEERRITQTV